MMASIISHSGIVEKVDGNLVWVRIDSEAACSGCEMKSRCMAAESEDKLISVRLTGNSSYSVGERVTVEGENEKGLRAVTWAFVYPLLLLLLFLLILIMWTRDELLSTVGAIVFLVPYFYILWLKRDSFKQKFAFRMKDERAL